MDEKDYYKMSLITTAPEMYDALKWFIEPDRPIGSDAELIHCFSKMAKEAIKKAEGDLA